ncbi:CBN-SPP-11 protein [Caenorhabditis brenneri]|uniref:CBN-SPP-11 protein n=1 Tax=Caenorhabditis brenneri TaxID=135651 RepID=G0MZM6_CAEBE|nr:CBN-SPP-11 protein [Caenorhabditis brenneri]
MFIYRFIALALFFISVHGIVEQKYNKTDVAAVQQFVFPTFKIPDLLNPDKSGSDSSASLPHLLPTALPKIPTIKLPTLPNLLPTALPKIPTVHIPTLPHILPTALPKLPTIKIPTLPHILPTALPKIPTIKIPTVSPSIRFQFSDAFCFQFPHILPTLFPPKPKPTSSSEGITPNTPYTLPYPLPSDVVPIPFLDNNTNPGDNLICNICESAVTIVKTKILTVEKSVRAKLGVLLGGLCDMLMSHPTTMFLGPPCTMFKANIIDKIFQKLDNFENSIDPKSFCKHVPFCK